MIRVERSYREVLKTVNYDVVVENKRMSQVSISLDGVFITILTAPSFDNFTVLELRSAFMALSNSELDKNNAQRVVYREILKLKNKGLLKRVDSKTTKKTTYVKTDLFHTVNFISKDSASKPVKKDDDNSGGQNVIKELTDRLQRYKGELQSLIAESNGYKSLYAEFPHLKGLQKNYNLARNNMNDIGGLIKSFETTIEDQKVLEENNDAS